MKKQRHQGIYAAPAEALTLLDELLALNWTYKAIQKELADKFAFKTSPPALCDYFKKWRANGRRAQPGNAGTKTITIQISVPTNASVKIINGEARQ